MRFPRLTSYLDQLPDGIDSHPECKAKAAILETALVKCPLGNEVQQVLPECLRQILAKPPAAREWINEVHLRAITLACADEYRMSDEVWLFWSYQQNRRLFEHSIMRHLMRMSSPSVLLTFGSMRWRSFHQGTTLSIESNGEKGATVRCDFPQNLFDRQLVDGLARGFQAGLEFSNARFVQVKVDERTETQVRLSATWM
jgi:hypothetical protein